jgi:hypothetical protein
VLMLRAPAATSKSEAKRKTPKKNEPRKRGSS